MVPNLLEGQPEMKPEFSGRPSEWREYVRTLRWDAFFEDAEDYEPGSPLAALIGEASGEVAGVESKIRSGDYPGAVRLAADLRRKGIRSRDLVVQHVSAWSLMNWLPASDQLTSQGEDDGRANLILARQAIAQGKGNDAVALTDLLIRKAPDVPHLQVLRRIAGETAKRDPSSLKSLRSEVEAMDDCSLHYFLAIVEYWHEPEAAKARLELCVERRPDVPVYIGRLMNVLISEHRWEETLRAFEENRQFASGFYSARRMALITRSIMEGYEAVKDELWQWNRDEPFDRVIMYDLVQILRRRRSYFKVLPLWIRSSKALLNEWPNSKA